MSTSSTAMIRQAGLNVTPGRVAVLDTLTTHSHIDAAEVFRYVSEVLPTTSIQSIYNVLADLTAAELVHRIEPAGSAALYECRVGDNHHHIICTGCSCVVDVNCAVGAAPCLDPDDDSGFQVERAEVIFWGLCPSCQSRPAETITI